jgi:hypothetical protein
MAQFVALDSQFAWGDNPQFHAAASTAHHYDFNGIAQVNALSVPARKYQHVSTYLEADRFLLRPLPRVAVSNSCAPARFAGNPVVGAEVSQERSLG